MTRRYRPILLGLGVLVLIGTVVMVSRKPAEARSKPAAAATARASLAVDVLRPGQAVWPMTLSADGALAAWQEATISAETGGLGVIALYVDVGSRVKRGQLVAELNSTTVKADVQKAEADVATARANLQQAQANTRRARAVQESGVLSGQQVEQYDIAEQSAIASLKAVGAGLTIARIKLAQTRIVAVDDGVISSRSATLGTVVSSGAELFRLVRGERVEWRAQVDAGQLTRLHKGQAATVTLPDGTVVEGKVRQLSPTLSNDTRTAIAYIDLPVLPTVHAGMYATGLIALGQRAAMTLPSGAITMRDGRSYVFEVNQQRRIVIQHEITTGRTRGGQVEVVSGLNAGTPVVRSGGAFLNDGDAVRIKNPQEAS